MLLCHSELGQPEFSAPVPGHQVVCNSLKSGNDLDFATPLNLQLSSPLAELLQDHHQLLWGGCVEMCRQVVKPEVRFRLIFEEPNLSLF